MSTVDEAHAKVDFIFAVKVKEVSQPQKEYTGAEPYPIELQFELIETLKGAATAKTNAIYTQPAIERRLDDGKVMRVWLKVLASGKELSVAKGGKYLLYAQKHGIQDDERAIRIVRIDPMSEKSKLVEAMKKMKTSQQSDGEATSKTAPSAVPEASHP